MEKNIMEEFEKDMALYRKYEETVRAIIALAAYDKSVKSKEHFNFSIYDFLMEKIIKNLEDERISININYKGSCSRLYNDMIDYRTKLHDKYKKLVDDELLTELEKNIRRPDNDYDLVEYSNKYCTTNDWDKEMLYSNMPLKMRKEIFLDSVIAAGKYASNRALNLLNLEKSGYGYPEYLPGYESKKNNLKLLLYSMDMDDSFKKEVVQKLKARTIEILQEEEVINFAYEDAIYDIIDKTGGYNYESQRLIRLIFPKVYNPTSEEKDKYLVYMINNTKPLIINETIYELARLDFEVDQTVINTITRYIIENWDSIEDPNEVRKLVAEKIFADKLIKKSKNKNEYKKNLNYYRTFLYETDVDTRRHKLELWQKAKEEERKRLTSLLSDLNEKLLEEVPAKRLLKEIDFKKLS